MKSYHQYLKEQEQVNEASSLTKEQFKVIVDDVIKLLALKPQQVKYHNKADGKFQVQLKTSPNFILRRQNVKDLSTLLYDNYIFMTVSKDEISLNN